MSKYFDLPSGIVIQRTTVSQMTQENMSNLLNQLIDGGKKVRVVESASEFFNDANFFAAVNAGDVATITLISEQRGIVLSDDELDNIRGMVSFKDELRARLDAQRPPYQFAELPADWKFDQQIRVTAKGVYRAGNSDYKIGLKVLERIWGQAARVWAALDSNKNIDDIRVSGYTRSGEIRNDRIVIGCQHIQRYELEQLALSQCWEIPSK
jgi:hypothetical protein